MVHKLALVAVAGLTISAVCLGAGGALEGKDFGARTFGDDGTLASIFGEGPRCENGGGYPINRTLDWDGSDHVGIAIPGQTTYAPGNDDKLHVSGNPLLVPHVRVRDGKVELDCRMGFNGAHDLTVTLPGRAFKKFSITGSGNLTLNNLNQDRLELSIRGSGSIKGDGKLQNADASIRGSGDINIAQVNAAVVKVEIRGSGNTDIAPTDEADISIRGSGDVNLHSDPKKLETHIRGSGRIHNIRAGG
jgi:hypothetical protein